ncbi:MAG: ATP-binding protein [Paracoccaceae bacterium]
MVENANIFQAHFTSDPESVATVIQVLIDAIFDHCHQAETVSDIEIVVTEVINNIVEHAYANRPGMPADISAVAVGSCIEFTLTDRGVELPNHKLPTGNSNHSFSNISELPEGGFGWDLIYSLANNIRYVRKGGENCLTFSVTIDDSQPLN